MIRSRRWLSGMAVAVVGGVAVGLLVVGGRAEKPVTQLVSGDREDIFLIGSGGAEVALSRAARYAGGIPALNVESGLPGELTLWSVSARYDLAGARVPSPANQIVLDYYQGNAPGSLAEFLPYKGVRVQVTFYNMQVTPDNRTPRYSAPGVDFGQSTVFRVDAPEPGVASVSYYIVGLQRTVSVRLWNTAGGRIPTEEETLPAIQMLARAVS